MKLKLEYHKQAKGLSSCGPVCLKMIFEHLGKKYSERELIELCDAVPNRGTSHKNMIDSVKKTGFFYFAKSNGSINELISYVKKGYPVIVNYLNPKSKRGHYSILIGIDENGEKLTFADPSNGYGYKLGFKEFDRIWHNRKKTSWRWFLIINKEKILNPIILEDEAKE